MAWPEQWGSLGPCEHASEGDTCPVATVAGGKIEPDEWCRPCLLTMYGEATARADASVLLLDADRLVCYLLNTPGGTYGEGFALVSIGRRRAFRARVAERRGSDPEAS